LDVIFEKSTFSLFDPEERNVTYVSDRLNTYNHIQDKFDYSTVNSYGFIQDDAYVEENNRSALDPKGHIFNLTCGTVKMVKGDRYVWHSYWKRSRRQVGKTKGERRYYYPGLRVVPVNERDERWGSCDFCRDCSLFARRGFFSSAFFDAWGRLHPPTIPCTIREDVGRGSVCLSGYTLSEKQAGSYYVEVSIPDRYSLSIDPVPDTSVHHTFNRNIPGWYVFSKELSVPQEVLYGGRYAIAHGDLFLTTHFVGSSPMQEPGECDLLLFNKKFLSEDLEKCRYKFSKYVDLRHASSEIPLIDILADDDNLDVYFISFYNYYDRVRIKYRSNYYISAPKMIGVNGISFPTFSHVDLLDF